jgi:hypothetical protein
MTDEYAGLTPNNTPGWEGSKGPTPYEYRTPHVYARDIGSGAGNCVCGLDLGHHIHVQAAPGVPVPDRLRYSQPPGTGRPVADLAHAAEDVRKHLALRTRAVNDEVLDNPEVIATVRTGGESHALTETVLRTLLAERDALAAYVPDQQQGAPDAPATQRLKAAVAKANAGAPPLAMRIVRNAYQHLVALDRDGHSVINISDMLELLNAESPGCFEAEQAGS